MVMARNAEPTSVGGDDSAYCGIEFYVVPRRERNGTIEGGLGAFRACAMSCAPGTVSVESHTAAVAVEEGWL